eukprot:TRINITY_DN44838_c0_g1_i1.p2 TRINITY_DN44838_c0_g1~~TRINITY_DN44838_c0_g1_i1.p2  ORF type:complete len:372 (+),score=79.14 TRINITY_DN44838_c0_g1_i1:72-1118(+)
MRAGGGAAGRSGAGRLSLVPCGAAATGDGWRWRGCCALGGVVYCAPCNAPALLAFDPGAPGAAPRAVDVSSVAVGDGKWHGAAVAGGKVWCAPSNAAAVLCYDPSRDAVSGHSVEAFRGSDKWRGLCSVTTAAGAERLVCAPADAPCALVIDPVSGESTGIDVSCAAEGRLKWTGCAAVGQLAYCAPYDTRCVLVLDAGAGTCKALPVPPELGASCDGGWHGMWSGAAAVGGRVLFAPYNAQCVLVCDCSSGALSAIDSGAGCGGRWKWTSPCTVDGVWFAAPYHAAAPLCVRAELGTVEQGPPAPGGVGGRKWHGAAAIRAEAGGGQRVVFAPFHADALLVWELDGA